MINIRESDRVIKVGLSTHDTITQPTQLLLTNIQSNIVYVINLDDTEPTLRCGIYNLYLVRDEASFLLTHTPAELAALKVAGSWLDSSITYLYLPDGQYNYVLGNQKGILKIIADVDTKHIYNYQTKTNNIYYKG